VTGAARSTSGSARRQYAAGGRGAHSGEDARELACVCVRLGAHGRRGVSGSGLGTELAVKWRGDEGHGGARAGAKGWRRTR
jgi:hypothetical protein